MRVIINGSDLINEIYDIEHHLHNDERWFGLGATEDSLTPYHLISGAGIYGSEVLLLDTGDTPFQTGKTKFDFHKVFALDVDQVDLYYLRLIWGTGTVGDAEAAGQYTTIPIKKIIATGQATGVPVAIINKRVSVGTKVWGKIKNATNLATLDVVFGLHEYDR